MSHNQVPIVLALDGLDTRAAIDLCRVVGPRVYAVKIHDMFDQLNCEAVTWLKQAGAQRVWVDYKLHDIAKTVGLRAKALAEAGADIISVHASGHLKMIQAAVESCSAEIYGVTVLTSLDTHQCIEIFGDSAPVKVPHFAGLVAQAGAHGVVCSPQEVGALAAMPSLKGLRFVVPGVRSAGQDTHDQARVGTPAQAVAGGASLLVIGRQVTTAKDPLIELEKISQEILS
jgi:orotidine-5'-phosphate decarboxylase